jgi:phosphate transport system protein
VGRHLRFLIASFKIAIELERIADYANNIAKRVQKKMPKADLVNYMTTSGTIKAMGEIAVNMLEKAMTAYQNNDATTVDDILVQVDAVNALKRKLLQEISGVGVANSTCKALLELHTSIRYIERVADRAINIGEAVFYLETGFPYTKKRNTKKLAKYIQNNKEHTA